MDEPKFTPDLRQRLFAALTGRAGDVTGRPGGDLRALLQAAFGEGRRPGGVDTRAAAERLKVSQRTVQRWLAGPDRQSHGASPEHLRTITRLARQAASTQRGRAAATATARQDADQAVAAVRAAEAAAAAAGPAAAAEARQEAQERLSSTLSVRGKQGPLGYERVRRIIVAINPEAVQAGLGAYERGGDRAFVAWLEGQLDQDYAAGWNFVNIQDFGLGAEPDEPQP